MGPGLQVKKLHGDFTNVAKNAKRATIFSLTIQILACVLFGNVSHHLKIKT